MKLIISGASHYSNRDRVWRVLEDLKPTVIVTMDYPIGAESLARNWAFQSNSESRKVNVKLYKVSHGESFDKVCKQMLTNECDCNAVILFQCDHSTLKLIDMANELELTVLNVEE